MEYYCAVHKDEDQQALQGEPLDALTEHMVVHRGYDKKVLRDFIHTYQPQLVLWRLTKQDNRYIFTDLVGIPQ